MTILSLWPAGPHHRGGGRHAVPDHRHTPTPSLRRAATQTITNHAHSPLPVRIKALMWSKWSRKPLLTRWNSSQGLGSQGWVPGPRRNASGHLTLPHRPTDKNSLPFPKDSQPCLPTCVGHSFKPRLSPHCGLDTHTWAGQQGLVQSCGF